MRTPEMKENFLEFDKAKVLRAAENKNAVSLIEGTEKTSVNERWEERRGIRNRSRYANFYISGMVRFFAGCSVDSHDMRSQLTIILQSCLEEEEGRASGTRN